MKIECQGGSLFLVKERERLLSWFPALCGSDCGCWCQMKTDGRGFCQGLGPAPGSCPWYERFHLLVDVQQPDTSRPWIKAVWAERLWEPVSGWPCCSTQHQNALFIINTGSISVWLLLLLGRLPHCRVVSFPPKTQSPDLEFFIESLSALQTFGKCLSEPKPEVVFTRNSEQHHD